MHKENSAYIQFKDPYIQFKKQILDIFSEKWSNEN